MKIYEENYSHETRPGKERNVHDRTEVFGPNPPDKTHHDMLGLLRKFLDSFYWRPSHRPCRRCLKNHAIFLQLKMP